MRLSWVIYPLVCFIIAACLCVLAAGFSVRFIEEASKDAINQSFKEAGLTWAQAEADGLQVFIIGHTSDQPKSNFHWLVQGCLLIVTKLLQS